MRRTRLGSMCASPARLGVAIVLSVGYVATAAAQGTRRVTFMDVQDMGSPPPPEVLDRRVNRMRCFVWSVGPIDSAQRIDVRERIVNQCLVIQRKRWVLGSAHGEWMQTVRYRATVTPLQPADTARKSPLVAALLTVGTTGVPPILGAYFVNEGPEDLGVAMYLGSLLFGPAVGSLYAGNTGHALRHFALAGGTFVGFWWTFFGTSLPWSGGCDVDSAPREGSAAIGFALGYVANWIWGLGTGITDAQRHTERINVGFAPQRNGRFALGTSVRS